MTIEVRNIERARLDFFLTFVAFTWEELDPCYTNLIVSDEDCDNLTDLLDRYNYEWRLV